MPAEVHFEREGVRLAGLDYGGDGPSILLLHGLAGHAGEWAETAGWLTERCRVVALDARGHGDSERLPPDVSPGAHVADAAGPCRSRHATRPWSSSELAGAKHDLHLDRPAEWRQLLTEFVDALGTEAAW